MNWNNTAVSKDEYYHLLTMLTIKNDVTTLYNLAPISAFLMFLSECCHLSHLPLTYQKLYKRLCDAYTPQSLLVLFHQLKKHTT